MSRALTILIALAILALAFFVIKDAKKPVQEAIGEHNGNTSFVDADFHNWREFTAPTGEFRALFPSLPQQVTDKIIDPRTQQPNKYDMFAAAEDQGSAFVISAITYPNIHAAETENILRSVIADILARNKENRLKMSKVGTFKGLHSLDFSLTSGDLTITGKAILRDNTLYVLSMVDKSENFNSNKFDFFVNSFDLGRKAQQASKPLSEEKNRKKPF